ncbi:MAG: hypothetical protein JNK29_02220 [Anaerolineales bacterium]|nr:hypothetical protein [Anaerolineales bacterium]
MPKLLRLLAALLVLSGLAACQPPRPPVLSASFVLGRYAYAGFGSQLRVYELVQPEAPRLIGEVSDEGRLFGQAQAVGGWLYTVTAALDGQTDFLIYSLEAPAQPRLVSRLPLAETYLPAFLAADGFAYLATAPRLTIINLHDPARPELAGQLDVMLGPRLHKLGGRLYSSYGYCGSRAVCLARFVTVDVSDPAAPRLASEYTPEGLYYGYTLEHLSADGRAVLGVGAIRSTSDNPGVDYGVRGLDVRDPARPALTGTHLIDGYVRAATDQYAVYLNLDGTRIAAARLAAGGQTTLVSEAQLPEGHYTSEAVIAGEYAYIVTTGSEYVDQVYRQDNALLALPLTAP